MPRGNPNNLVQNKNQTPDERQKNAQKAGIVSGEKRREKRQLQNSLQRLLSGKYELKDDKGENTGERMVGYDAIAKSMKREAHDGNVKAFVAIRDTIGEKPKESIGLESESLSGISIKFVNKSDREKRKPEEDPKIIGDYTPATNIDDEE